MAENIETWNNLPYNQLFPIRGIECEFLEMFGSPPHANHQPLITE